MIHLKRLLSGVNQPLTIMPARYIPLLIALTALLILALPGFLMAQDTDKTDQWQFMIEPYVWIAGIGGATSNGTDINVGFDDIVSNLKFAYMGVLGVKKGKWSFIVDPIYLSVKKTQDGSISYSGNSFNSHTEVNAKAWVVTPVIGYNIIDCKRGKLDIVAGARYLDVQVDVDVNIATPNPVGSQLSVSGDVWDGVLGVKSEIALYEKFYIPIYLDVGTGNSDLTWQVAGGLGYRFSLCDLVAGYRYLNWDFGSSSSLKNMNLSGPYVGVKFVF
jgi:hypothetical protein